MRRLSARPLLADGATRFRLSARPALLAAGLVFALLLSGLVGCAGAPKYDPADGYRHVDADEAAALIASEDCVVVDVRSQVSYDLGHIPGAVLIPADELHDPASLALLPDKDGLIVVYCDYGGLSKTAAKELASQGYTNVVEFDGLEVWDGALVSE